MQVYLEVIAVDQGVSLSQVQCNLFSLSSDQLPRDCWGQEVASESYRHLY
jgi:hypothetical protein